MSNYGNPPEQNPYGQDPQNPYGQAPGHGQNPYGQAPAYGPGQYGAGPYGQAPQPGGPGMISYAHWGKRVGAFLIDNLILNALAIPIFFGVGLAVGTATTDPVTGEVTYEGGGSAVGWALLLLGIVLPLVFFVWNFCIRQGRTGYSIGKGVLGIRLLGANDGQPIGAGMSFVRQIAHILDQLPCYIGYLWPLWDSKRQTFADKVCNTVVIDQPRTQ